MRPRASPWRHELLETNSTRDEELRHSAGARPGPDLVASARTAVKPAPARTVIAAGTSAVLISTCPFVAAASSSATETSASRRPCPMTISWSAVSSSSLMRWLETKTVRPSAANLRNVSRIHWIPSGRGRWSARRVSGSVDRRATRRRSRGVAHSERERSARLRATSRARRARALVRAPRRNAIALRKPAEVASRRAARMERAARRAARRRPSAVSRGRVPPPLMSASPASAVASPSNSCIVVVFPAPFGPTNPVTLPGPHDDRQLVDGDRAP